MEVKTQFGRVAAPTKLAFLCVHLVFLVKAKNSKTRKRLLLAIKPSVVFERYFRVIFNFRGEFIYLSVLLI